MKRNLLLLILFLSGATLFAQNKQNLGVTVGLTHFTSDSEAFNNTENDGLSLGFAANFVLAKRSELTLELKYNRHTILFETLDNKGEIEDVELILKQVEIPFTYTFNVLASRNFNLGLNLGASANFFHEYSADDTAQEEFELQPSDIEVNNLFFDTFDEKIGFNVYLIGGASIRLLKHFLFTVRYYHGVTNPFRQAENDNPISNFETEVSYYFYGVTYFF